MIAGKLELSYAFLTCFSEVELKNCIGICPQYVNEVRRSWHTINSIMQWSMLGEARATNVGRSQFVCEGIHYVLPSLYAVGFTMMKTCFIFSGIAVLRLTWVFLCIIISTTRL